MLLTLPARDGIMVWSLKEPVYMATRYSTDEEMMFEDERPCFVISIAARMAQMHEQTLRSYERLGLVVPSRSQGRIRLYSVRDVERLRQIRRLMDDLGVNLAGVEVIMNLTARISELETDM